LPHIIGVYPVRNQKEKKKVIEHYAGIAPSTPQR
jgi:hypothetical protein